MPNIVVVGAGVSGLTSALLLSRNPDYQITVIGKHHPGDYDIEYTSPWAGANFMPFSDREGNKLEKETWPELARLAKDVPEAGIHFQESIIYNRDAKMTSASQDLWYKDTMPNWRFLSKEEVPAGMDSGFSFTSVCINLPIYLGYLVGECLKNGVVLKRGIVAHIADAAGWHHTGQPADVIINCTGLLARRLGGVMDTTVVPVRGQTVLVRNELGGAMMGILEGERAVPDEGCYLMQRAAGGGTVLGGTFQPDNWDSQPDPNVATRIMARAVALWPSLTNGKGVEALSVIRHAVGLRPWRTGGVRLEKERIRDHWVVHNYGHSGWGYQGSYACSHEVVRLVADVLASKAKL